MKIININTKEILEVEQEHLIAVLKHNKDFKIYYGELDNNELNEVIIEDNSDKEELEIDNIKVEVIENTEVNENEENINTKSDNVDNEKIIQKKQKKTRSKNINKTENIGENNE